MNTNIRATVILIVLLSAVLALAQSGGTFEIVWSSVEPGGTSSGGTYSLRGTAGQPDAGEMSGGTYALHGGFGGGSGTVTSVDDPGGQSPRPAAYRLYPNVPNPFNPATSVRFDLPVAGHVRVSVYDVGGRQIRALVDEHLPAGSHTTGWDGFDSSGDRVASGIYLLVIDAGRFHDARKITMLK